MKIRYAYEYQGVIVHVGTETTGHTSAKAWAEAMAGIPKARLVDHVLAWNDPTASPGTHPDARVAQRAKCGV